VSPVECMWYRTMLGFGVQLLQQFSGINAVRVSLFFLFLYFGFSGLLRCSLLPSRTRFLFNCVLRKEGQEG